MECYRNLYLLSDCSDSEWAAGGPLWGLRAENMRQGLCPAAAGPRMGTCLGFLSLPMVLLGKPVEVWVSNRALKENISVIYKKLFCATKYQQTKSTDMKNVSTVSTWGSSGKPMACVPQQLLVIV